MMEEFKAKVVLVGAPGVGKTSLVRRYVLNEFSDRYRMTLGAIVYKRIEEVAVDDRIVRVTMTLWDTMGEPQLLDPLREVYLQGAQGVLAVCDVTDGETVPTMNLWVKAADQIAGDVPVQILMNKWDLGPKVDVKFAGLTAGLEHAAPCWLTSAKSGDNVTAAFQDLARRIVERNLVPLEGNLDEQDQAILVDLSTGPKSAEQVAKTVALSHIATEARLERMRRREFLRISTLGLNDDGRPRASYARTGRSLGEALTIKG
jgi:small GTP-binding protein